MVTFGLLPAKPCNAQIAIDLLESTQIIRELIMTDKLCTIIDATKEQVDLFINNFSPAQLALEAEVLSCQTPVIACYCTAIDHTTIELIQQLAEEYTTIKFVIIDADALFSLVQDSDIQEVPVLCFVQNREIIDRISLPIARSVLQQKITELLKA